MTRKLTGSLTGCRHRNAQHRAPGTGQSCPPCSALRLPCRIASGHSPRCYRLFPPRYRGQCPHRQRYAHSPMHRGTLPAGRPHRPGRCGKHQNQSARWRRHRCAGNGRLRPAFAAAGWQMQTAARTKRCTRPLCRKSFCKPPHTIPGQQTYFQKGRTPQCNHQGEHTVIQPKEHPPVIGPQHAAHGGAQHSQPPPHSGGQLL